MKKTLLSVFCTISLFASCSSELEQTINDAFPNQIKKPETGVMTNIKNYINHMGSNGIASRNANDCNISPYIHKGDTVMYVASYSDGWELFSTDRRVPMVIMSSDTGTFNFNEIENSLAFSTYINSVAEELWQVKNSDNTEGGTFGLWNLVSIQNNEVDLQKIRIADKARGTQPGEDGYWVLLETTTPITETITTNKLTSTQWGQNNPWNTKIPYSIDNPSKIGPIGCEGVAAAQYLYYLHFKNGIPANTVTTAIYNSSNNIYTYSGNSSTIWNNMATSSSGNYSAINNTAIFLGYVSKEIETDYYSMYGEASFLDAIDFINSQSGQNYYATTIDYDYVNAEIGAGRAVYARAENANGEGHAFIIDKKRITCTTSTSTYGWVGKDNTGEDSNDYDEEGNIVGYSYFFEKENRIESTDYFMNWGWNGNYDNVACTASSGSDWNVGYHFNSTRKIAKQ